MNSDNRNNQAPFVIQPDSPQTPLLPKRKFPLLKVLFWLAILLLVLVIVLIAWFFKDLIKEKLFQKEEIIESGLQEIDFQKDIPSLPDFSPAEVIVQFSNTAKKEEIDQLLKEQGYSIKEESKEAGFVILGLPENKNVIDAIDYLKKLSFVEEAEPDYYVAINATNATPNDTWYKYQWNLHGPEAGGINMAEVWDKTATLDTSSMVIAVVDTGVTYENYGSFKKGTDFENISFVQGYDFVNNDSHPNDDNGHGTFITSIIGSSINNNKAVAGIVKKIKIMPVKVIDQNAQGKGSHLAEGIYYAVNNGAKVLNVSVGAYQPVSILERAVLYARSKGAVVVASCGNKGKSGWCDYPAAYDNYVIPVSATTYGGEIASYSNVKQGVVFAPGGDLKYDYNRDGLKDGIIGQTAEPGKYALSQGTSFAAPHIAALAALLLVTKPELSLPEVKEILRNYSGSFDSPFSPPC